MSCQAIGDVDEDGSVEMAIMSQNGMFLVDIGGEQPITKWTIDREKLGEWFPGNLAMPDPLASYQLIVDIDGDGNLEIIWFAPFPIVVDGATGDLKDHYLNDDIAVGRRPENGGWWGDVDKDGISELICELTGKPYERTKVYCLTMDGSYPAKAVWPEFYHSAMPIWEQHSQGLSLIGAYSNSLWFPIGIDYVMALVKDLYLVWGVNSLLSILGNVKKKIEQGNNNAIKNQLKAFQNHVRVQSGNKIPAKQADILLSEAQKIIDSLGIRQRGHDKPRPDIM